MNKTVDIFVDGSIRGNGKPNAFGGVGVVAISDKGVILSTKAILVPAKTNNQSEYMAVMQGMQLGEELGRAFKVYSDSELIVNQLLGKYTVTNSNIIPCFMAVKELIAKANFFEGIVWIPREDNTIADELAQTITKEAKKKIQV
jgi:ribonuclease HI